MLLTNEIAQYAFLLEDEKIEGVWTRALYI